MTMQNNGRSNACKGCIYHGKVSGIKDGCCNYIFIVGKRRPCPPGKDCKVREKKTRRNARELTITGKTMSVLDCAKLTGISKDTIYSWYAKFGREVAERKVIDVWKGRKEDGK